MQVEAFSKWQKHAKDKKCGMVLFKDGPTVRIVCLLLTSFITSQELTPHGSSCLNVSHQVGQTTISDRMFPVPSASCFLAHGPLLQVLLFTVHS